MAAEPEQSEPQATEDGFLNGAVRVLQPAVGYRAGLDAVLLAASVSAEPGQSLAEAGSGAGAALLCAAHRLDGIKACGFERDEAMASLARRSVGLNGFEARVELRRHNIEDRPADLENRFDLSMCNPPFFEPGTARAPGEGKQAAYVLDTPLKSWVRFLAHVTRRGGYITLVHRAAALADVLELLSPRCGEIEVLPVRPAPGLPARRILVRGRKGLRRGPVTLHAGLDLHVEPGGASSPRAAEVLAGGCLDWR
ncbi:MAG: methyltransferase [Hyphomonadaceae bacterium]